MDLSNQQKNLQQLLYIKKHRQKRLERDLMHNKRAIAKCHHAIQELRKERRHLIPAWRSCNETSIQIDKGLLTQRLNAHYGFFFKKDQDLLRATVEKQKEIKNLEIEGVKIFAALKKVQAQEEKFKSMQDQLRYEHD